MSENLSQGEKKAKTNWYSRIRRIMTWVIILAIGLPLLISLILQIPTVQTWLGIRVSRYLSEKMEAKVSLKHIDFGLVHGLKLDDFLIQKINGDTILASDYLEVNLYKNIFSLVTNDLSVNTVSLEKPKVHFLLDRNSKRIDFLVMLDKIIGKKKEDNKKSTFNLELKRLVLTNPEFSLDNELNATLLQFDCKKLDVNVNDIDLPSNHFDIQSLELDAPNFSQLVYGIAEKMPTTGKSETESTSSPLSLEIRKLAISNGSVDMDTRTYSDSKDIAYFDKRHIKLTDIDLNVSGFQYCGNASLELALDHFSFKELNGFELEKMSCPSFVFNQRNVLLPNFKIKTVNSSLIGDFKASYSSPASFNDFANKVLLDAKIESANINFKELAYLVPEFSRSTFYKNNAKRNLEISGKLTGKVNSLKGTAVALEIPGLVNLVGNFGTRDITNAENALINLRLNSLETSVSSLKLLIPNFSPPENFTKLGKLYFNGNFDGYLSDFVAFGHLKTDLGNANMDMRLDLKEGMDNARYSGDLSLKNFDLKRWSGNENFGFLSIAAKVKDGKGLTQDKATVDVEAKIDEFYFKGYSYRNLNFDGQLDKSKFDGKFISVDPNFNINFDGKLNFAEENLVYDFKSHIGRIDLAALNLTKIRYAVTGDIILKGEGKNLNSWYGTLTSKDLYITKNDTIYDLGKINLTSSKISENRNQLQLTSDDVAINLDGQYDFGALAQDVTSILHHNYGQFAEKIGIKPGVNSGKQNLTIKAKIKDGHSIFKLLNVHDLAIKGLEIDGNIHGANNKLDLALTFDEFDQGKNAFYNSHVTLKSNGEQNLGSFSLDSFAIDGRRLHKAKLDFTHENGNFDFSLNADGILDSIQQFSLNGILSLHSHGYRLLIKGNEIRINDQRWKINTSTDIVFGNQYIDLNNVEITDGRRLFHLDDINNRGLIVNVDKFNFQSISDIIKYDKMNFRGDISTTLKIDDVFSKSPEVIGSITIPDFSINGDNYGLLNIDVSKPKGLPFDGLITLVNQENGQNIKLNATYNLEDKKLEGVLKGKKVPLKFLEYILKDGISGIKGYGDVNATIEGVGKEITIDGKGTLYDGRVKINSLGEIYYFNDQDFIITDKIIDLTGSEITDSEGNKASITGYLGHKMFGDFSINATIEGQNFTVLNTTKFDNPDYYGFGKGNISAEFSGKMSSVYLLINGVTTAGTTLNIPIQASQGGNTDNSFIHFTTKEKLFDSKATDQSEIVKDEGLTIEMNLQITEDSEVNLIFNEDFNDIIKGRGNGNLKINKSRAGDFNIFGEYVVEEGQYLFTALRGYVNKPFVVRRGGTVRWNGDPVNARINIETEYAVRTPVNVFLSEYLTAATDDLKNAAQKSTMVNLKLIIGNTLFNPTIRFDFEFPELLGELKSFTDSKVRLLRNNETDFNNQAFGLIIFNTFLPTSTLSSLVPSNAANIGLNTVSEFLSNQFSLLVTSFLNDALEENSLISGIDFDLDLRNNNASIANTETQSLSFASEIEIRLKNRFRFWDERLSLNLGGNYIRDATVGIEDYIIPEISVEYALTSDRKVSLKLYTKYDFDEVNINNRRLKSGAGIRFKTEFSSMLETKSALSDFFKTSIKKN